MIRKIKQKIRTYLTEKYDAEYYQELEQQTISYDDWVWEKENVSEEKEMEIVWDLEKEKRHKLEQRKGVSLISYAELDSMQNLMDRMKELSQECQIVILAEDSQKVAGVIVDKIVDAFVKHKQAELLYGDEDEVNHNENVRMNPWLKPDYSPDTLLSYFYFGKLVAIRKETLKTTAECLSKKQKEADLLTVKESVSDREKQVSDNTWKSNRILYSVVLEICTKLKRDYILHLKQVLYSSHCIRYWGFEEEYQDIRTYYNNLRERDETDGVSIVIPSKDNPEVLERCLKSIVRWTKDISYEIIVVDNGSNSENKIKLEKLQQEYEFSYVYQPMEFNFSEMCNIGAHQAKKSLLLFLNDDCEVRGSKWLSHMAALATVKTTGAVGAKLYYPESKRIQHCGIYNIQVGPVHKLQFKEDIRPYYDRRNMDVRNVLAVTAACLMVRKSVFEKINGFDENLKVAFNDVDFCYKLYRAGYDNVIDNEIHLWHHESLSRGSDESPEKLRRLMQEKQKLYAKHHILWEEDPYYHPGFTTDILDTGYSFDYEYPHHKHLAVEHPAAIASLPTGTRMDECVAVMVEYAGDLNGWFLEDDLVEKIQTTMNCTKAAYLQGNAVILGSNNACYEKKIILRNMESGQLYQMLPEWYYRPDVFCNLQDQVNVALSGFACLLNMEEMQPGRYEVGILVKDRISGQHLLKVTTRSIENR